jgi:hypothetical protein
MWIGRILALEELIIRPVVVWYQNVSDTLGIASFIYGSHQTPDSNSYKHIMLLKLL